MHHLVGKEDWSILGSTVLSREVVRAQCTEPYSAQASPYCTVAHRFLWYSVLPGLAGKLHPDAIYFLHQPDKIYKHRYDDFQAEAPAEDPWLVHWTLNSAKAALFVREVRRIHGAMLMDSTNSIGMLARSGSQACLDWLPIKGLYAKGQQFLTGWGIDWFQLIPIHK